jgi:hypothetical protein
VPTTPDLIEDAFRTAAAAVVGVASALDYEPKELAKLPCVTMLYLGSPQEDAETGTGQDATHTWRIGLYLHLQDYKKAQQKLKDLLPLVMRIVRTDPQLNATCEWARLVDSLSEPIFNHEEKWMLKTLRLEAATTEY